MTLEQCKRLKEIGFPQYEDDDDVSSHYWNNCTDEEEWQNFSLDLIGFHNLGRFCVFANPTAEEALEWVKSKLSNGITIIPKTDGYDISYRCIFDKKNNETLSDAVYALIEWCYENKLLEGK